jgi:hypothetical protein
MEQLQDNTQKTFLKEALKERDRMQIGLRDPYRKEFDFMVPAHTRFELVHDYFRYHITPKALQEINLPLIQHDEFVKKIAVDLIRLNIWDYLWVYRGSVIENLGGYYSLSILLCLMIFGAVGYIRVREPICLFLASATFLQLANYMFIALTQPILRRYVFYTEKFYLLSVILALFAFYQHLTRKPCK